MRVGESGRDTASSRNVTSSSSDKIKLGLGSRFELNVIDGSGRWFLLLLLLEINRTISSCRCERMLAVVGYEFPGVRLVARWCAGGRTIVQFTFVGVLLFISQCWLRYGSAVAVTECGVETWE